MIALILRGLLIYFIYLFVRGVIKGFKGEKKEKVSTKKEDIIEAKFRRID